MSKYIPKLSTVLIVTGSSGLAFLTLLLNGIRIGTDHMLFPNHDTSEVAFWLCGISLLILLFGLLAGMENEEKK